MVPGKVQVAGFRQIFRAYDTAAPTRVTGELLNQVNTFLGTLQPENVLDVRTTVSGVGKYSEFSLVLVEIIYLEEP
jgi:hypothetical protein